MFTELLFNLRAQGLVVGVGEWRTFLDAMSRGLATDLDSMYHLGRSLLCRGEADFDGFDIAFAQTFRDMDVGEDLRAKLEEWLREARENPNVDQVAPHEFKSVEDVLEALRERLREQKERHDGGNRWIGTGGKSPFGHSGQAENGVRVGGSSGGRSAVATALERRWEGYRGDRTLDLRELKVVLRMLRSLAHDGPMELDIDGTIDRTCKNAGDIELVERRARRNRLKVVLLMDAGGSMAPHAERVERLFSAASQMKDTFKSFEAYAFHNCVYNWLYKDIEQLDKVPTSEVLANLTPQHRLIFVGDASMAPYELFSAYSWPSTQPSSAGIDWLRRMRERCPASIWLNPDPKRFWQHPTVSAIGRIFPMYELSVEGLKDGIKKLRVPY
ncbi:MAG: VWA domain-containing protein [Deltaproteobacteria bacterium]|nr:MAG: VWA domain-containing protein [Deltaproteobacteria bacterium]